MRYYHLPTNGRGRLIARDGEEAYDLTSVKAELRSFRDLAAAADITDTSLDGLAANLTDRADRIDGERLDRDATLPFHPDEVWAAGVTYEISEQAREAESGMPDVYLDVYEAERPEIFFKATAGRTVGPGEAIGVRGDSDWNVPEPELTVVMYGGEIVGYSIGNDVSSREIEGANPLYLPQAKVFDRCCSIGPCVASPDTVGDPHDLEMTMEIIRDGERVFDGTTSTSEMARTCEELVSYYRRHNAVPEVSALLTGTSLVPPDDFTLRADDEVHIDIESIGTLENPVVSV